MLVSPRDYRTIPLWRDVSNAEWGDYRWQMRNRCSTAEEIERIVPLTQSERSALATTSGIFRFGISPHYATLIDPDDPDCPIRRQAIPVESELHVSDIESADPLLEDASSPSPALVHRYNDRVLLVVTHECPIYCRYCTRRRIVGDGAGIGTGLLIEAIDYIRRTPAIRDVLLSGGDPLLLPDDRLDWILAELRSIEHVEIVRIGTRFPVALPQRITPSLAAILRRHGPVWVNTHFNHPFELAPDDTRRALDLLADSGVPTGNQSVLLKGVNDCPVVLRRLGEELIRHRCRPYYLYQCDLSEGLSHFRTSLNQGLQIIRELTGTTTGFALPTYVLDTPGGTGKVPLAPTTTLVGDERGWIVPSGNGETIIYPRIEEHRLSMCRHCGGVHSASRENMDRTFPPRGVFSTGSSDEGRSMQTM